MRTKRKPLDELTEIAREHIAKSLESHTISEELISELVMVTFWDGDDVVFELDILDETPMDTKLFARARVNTFTGIAAPVEVFPDLPRAMPLRQYRFPDRRN